MRQPEIILSKEKVTIEHIGRKPWRDNLYGTELEFVPGQKREVPPDVARNFQRHVDVFKVGAVKTEKPAKEEAKDEKPDDDTDKKLAEVAKRKQKEDERETRRLDAEQAVRAMTKEQMNDYAKSQFNQTLDMTQKKDALQESVIGMINQYGLE